MAIFEELKSIGKVFQEAGKIELYQQILDIQGKLLEMQKRIFDLEIENTDLQSVIKQKKKLVHIAEVYYSEDEDGRRGPYCTKCYDADGKMINMTEWGVGKKRCPNCEKSYRV